MNIGDPWKMRLGIALVTTVNNEREAIGLRQQMLSLAATWVPLDLRVQSYWVDNASGVTLPQPKLQWPVVLDKLSAPVPLSHAITRAISACFSRDADCVAVIGPHTWAHPDWLWELVSLVDQAPNGRLWSCGDSSAFPVVGEGRGWVTRQGLSGNGLLIPRISWELAAPWNGNWIGSLIKPLKPGPFYETDRSFVKQVVV